MATGDRGRDAGDGSDEDATRIDGDLALAETRVLEEEDKTSPPPVAASVRATPAPRPAPAPASREGRRDGARGLEPGTILFGEYEIVDVLGVGGMGEVYRAHHRRLDEHRAIKVMHAELSQRKGASEFFYREAKALLAVRHPAVVHCHDLLSDDAGRVYLIMELIEGIPLSKKLAEGPLSPDDVAVLGARVAHGLAAAHRKGVIHRDLSPDNIVLPNGRVHEAKIIDFGIAKLLEQGEGTIVDGFKGKLSYASPEQLGFFGGKIDGRSDLYSLGLVLAAASLGRPMGMGTTVMEAVDARRSFSRLPDGVPIGLRSAIQPLLALDPNDRPQYVDRLFVVPGAFDSSTDSGLGPSQGPARDGRDLRRGKVEKSRTGLVVALASVAALLVAGGAYLLLQPTEEPDAAATGAPVSIPSAVEIESPADASKSEGGESAKDRPAGNAPLLPGVVVAESGPAVPVVARVAPALAGAKAEKPIAVAAVKPAPAAKRGPSASDRLRIVGMLTNAKMALAEGRLMTPAGDNAYDRYRSVLRLEPGNATAKGGLREIASRLVQRANEAIDKGDTATARDHLRHARQADSGNSGIRAAESRLSGS